MIHIHSEGDDGRDELHLMDGSHDSDPCVWFCPRCSAVAVEKTADPPVCGTCGAVPCRACYRRRLARHYGRAEMKVTDEIRCEVHDWPTEEMSDRLFEAMTRDGGVAVCRACVTRARDAAQRLLEISNAERAASAPPEEYTTHVPMRPSDCPHCGKRCATASSMKDRRPRPGDVTLCGFCGGVCVFGKMLVLEAWPKDEPIPEEVREAQVELRRRFS